MTSQTYFFYDIETTGLSYSFDQVLQFAAIRTDLKFNELQRHEIIVKLRPDVVPSPAAMISHCMPLARVASGLCEYEATVKIHALLNEPGTISLGYNTLKFDDEFLRFAFFRNLLPPYTHQYANNCGRLDLLPIVTMFWLYKNEILEWPELEGKVSLKLEHLKASNNLVQGIPHNAMVDVEASLALARRLIKEQDLWDYLLGYFKKSTDVNRIQQLTPVSNKLPRCYKFGLIVNVEYGFEQSFQVPVLFIGNSEHYSNQSLWLRLDREELPEANLENLDEKTWVIRKKYGEPGFIIPAKDRYLDRLDNKRQEILTNNVKWLESNPDILQNIARVNCDFKYPEVPDTDLDGRLYQMGFMDDEEKEICLTFHKGDIAKTWKAALEFQNPELREIAERIFIRNYPDFLPHSLIDFKHHFGRQINPQSADTAPVDYRGRKKRIAGDVLAEIEDLLKAPGLTSMQVAVLSDLKIYLTNQFSNNKQLSLL